MKKISSLKMLILGITGQCNFACVYCYADKHPQQCMSIETAIKAINMAAVGGRPFVLQFSGGEPLLAFDVLQKAVRYVQQKNIPAILQVQTNGSLITPDMAAFFHRNRVGVGVSLDGRPGQNDLLRCLPSGAGTSQLIVRGANFLAAAKVEIGITCVVADSNVRCLPGIVEMAYYLGNVRKLGFDLLRAQGRGSAVQPANDQDVAAGLSAAVDKARQLEKSTGRRLLFSHLQRVENLAGKQLTGFAHCHAMNGEAAFVDAAGEIYACASLAGFSEYRLGNVELGIDFRQQAQIGEFIRQSMAFCPSCSSFTLCGGACFARWYGSQCPGAPYPPECALKNVFIKQYRQEASH